MFRADADERERGEYLSGGGSVVALLLAVALLAAGCPQGGGSGGPVEECERAGQQCRLGGGKLGVCTHEAGGELACESQH